MYIMFFLFHVEPSQRGLVDNKMRPKGKNKIILLYFDFQRFSKTHSFNGFKTVVLQQFLLKFCFPP